jgi:hypothetical protein
MRKAAKKRTAANSATSSRRRTTAKKAGEKGGRTAVRSGTKQSAAIEMLSSPGGATIAALTKATGWQPHSVRGFLAGVVRKRLELHLRSAVVEGVRIYRITGRHGAAPVEGESGRPPSITAMPKARIAAEALETCCVEAEIARLRALDLKALRAHWLVSFRRDAPAHVARHLLFAMLAYLCRPR